MNCKFGIIAASLIVCSLSGPAWGEMSESAAPGAEAAGHPLSAPGKGGGEAGINAFLDGFSGIGSSDPSSDGSYNPAIPIVPSISETTLYAAFTRADSTMNAYYSRSGTDNRGTMSAISRSVANVATAGGNGFALPEAGLAAAVQGHLVGSGAVVGAATIAPMQGSLSSPSIIQNTIVKPDADVPLPLPIILTGSGLAALLGLRKRTGIPEVIRS